MGLRRHWNRFLNWLIPGRRSRLISEIMKRDQELGLYDEWKNVTFPLSKGAMNAIVRNENKPCCGDWDGFGKCKCNRK